MGTIVNKIIFGLLFIFLSWKGLDGLILNLFYSSETSVDISELEQNPEIDSRNLEIYNGVAGGDFVYYQADFTSPVDIVYPLISHEQYEKLKRAEPISIRVLVRLNDQRRSCLRNQRCIPADSTTLKGIVKTGFENLNSSDFETLESDLITLDEHVILLEPGEKPIIWYWNLLMFLVGTTFGFTILKSFFRRASSIEEYWKKVAEKA